jgi:hypothetical protein
MTVYAYDETRCAIVMSWDAGVGCIASTLTELPPATRAEDALQLASALTGVSRELWRCYTHPGSASDSLEPNTEGWRRQTEREAFAEVTAALRSPNLPEDGYLIQSYVRVEEAAHRAGRALHAIDDGRMTDQVVADVGQEIDAVERAERGDLTGRARQAVVLTRADASPLQVVAANDLLRENPFGSIQLLQEVDATAAAIAAAHWLQAAAEIAAEQADCDPNEVVIEADNIEALAVRTPTAVLDRLDAGESPREVVVDMVRGAMMVAEGKIPDAGALVDQIEQAKTQAERYGLDGEEIMDGLMRRLTPLDPARPAQDLLEDLLDGIRGCFLLYCEYADLDDDSLDDESDTADDAQAEEFFDIARAEAEANQHRLL